MQQRAQALSPFARLRSLLGDYAPGMDPIDMSIGSPKHAIPDFVGPILAEHTASFRDYPRIDGVDALRDVIAAWITRRNSLSQPFDPACVLPLNGSREGLFSAAAFAVARSDKRQPAIALPNPFYHSYGAAGQLGMAETVYLSATAATGFLPDLDALSEDSALLQRLAVVYLASPSNPEGRFADGAYVRRAINLAREHDFLLIADECYSEIYDREAPLGFAGVALNETGSMANVLVVNSLSKRSNLAGLRSGFCAGERSFIEAFKGFRNIACPQVPIPIQHVSIAAWSDEAHVEANRELYREKFDLSDRLLGDAFGYERPPGGFFLWLDMEHFGGGEAAAVTLWKGYGVKVVPGAFLARTDVNGVNPGENFVRIALVSDVIQAKQALERVTVAFK